MKIHVMLELIPNLHLCASEFQWYILLVGTWVLTQSINILIDPTDSI